MLKDIEVSEDVPVTRNEAASISGDIGYCPKTIMLQLKDKFGMVERFDAARQSKRLNCW
jgi:hypothetical protein